ncbi:MAG: YitT family protein [Mogibacterium sp.]|nr:YitT family protein [Mogibacterium sp.]
MEEKKKRKNAEQQVMDSMDRKLMRGTPAVKEANVMAVKDPAYHGIGKTKAKLRDIMISLLAVVIGSIGTVGILIPNGLTIGGITGIARIIQHYTSWNYSLIYYAFSMIIMVIVWLSLGVRELRKIVLMSIAYPTVMILLEVKNVVLLESDDLFLVSVFCGVLFGISGGLTFKAGFSSGGADSLAKVIKFRYLPHIGINDITFVVNAVVVVASAFVFGINIALYAIIITYTQMRVGEAVMFGLSGKLVELEIIPGDAEALTEYVMKELGRGVSSIEVTGEYTGDKRKQLKILCSPRESFLIKRYLAHHDPKSFVSVTAVKSVWGVGRGFSDIHKIDD